MLTDDELQAIKARADAATRGPWVNDAVRICQGALHPEGDTLLHDDGADDTYSNFTEDDLAFIAHAREDIPKLLAEIDELKLRYNTLAMQAMEITRQLVAATKPRS